jgi:uncharacterized protein
VGKELIIVGIDPGTTLGYALLHLDGQIIRVHSSREFTKASLIKEIIQYGKPFIVGCDKKKIPEYVSEFGIKQGSILIKPPEDLSVKEKRDLVKGFLYDNAHEMDALASALYAYKKLRNQITKISFFIEKEKITDSADVIFSLVMKNNLSLKKAADLAAEDETEIIEEIQKDIPHSQVRKLLHLHDKLKTLKMNNNYLKSLLQKGKESEDMQKNINRILSTKIEKTNMKKEIDKSILEKTTKINLLNKELKKKDLKIYRLEKALRKRSDMLEQHKDNFLGKVIPTLSTKDINIKDIAEQDILCITNPLIYSGAVLEEIEKKKVTIVTRKKCPSKIISLRNVTILDQNNIVIISFDSRHILFDKGSFEKEKKNIFLVEKIIHNYQSERKGNKNK